MEQLADNQLQEIYVQYLYKVHAKTQTPLDNEPKCGNPAKLTGFKPGAANASKTILGFNRILWTNNGGYTKPGEELTDLSLGVRDEPEIQTTEERMFCFNIIKYLALLINLLFSAQNRLIKILKMSEYFLSKTNTKINKDPQLSPQESTLR